MQIQSAEEGERMIHAYENRNKKIETEFMFNCERIAIIRQHVMYLNEANK